MLSSRAAAAAILLAVPAAADANDWRLADLALGEGNRTVTYVDAGSVKPRSGLVRFRSDHRLERPRGGYDRIAATAEADCKAMTLTVLREAYYSGAALVAFGEVPRRTSHYSPSSSGHWLLRSVCGQRYLAQAQDGPAADSKRLFALGWEAMPGALAIALPAEKPRGGGSIQVASAAAAPAAIAGR